MIEKQKHGFNISFSSDAVNSSGIFEKNLKFYKEELKKLENLLRWRHETSPAEQRTTINRFEMLLKTCNEMKCALKIVEDACVKYFEEREEV